MSTLQLRPGSWATLAGERVRVVALPSVSEVLIQDVGGALMQVRVEQLLPEEQAHPAPARRSHPTDSAAHAAAQEVAAERLSILEPLLRLGPERRRVDVRAVARAQGIGTSTLYRWLAAYEQAGSGDALLRRPRADLGRGRLGEAAERLIEAAIERYYLTLERPTLRHVYERLRVDIDRANRTREAGAPAVPVPGFSSFRRRVYRVEERRRLSRRYGPKVAAALRPILGAYPGATYPLAVVQVDHTPLDLILVDAVHRKPIGRAWLTLIMDVYSRCVLGYSVSFDRPSAFGTGVALAHAILPKEGWLARHQEELSAVLARLNTPGAAEAREQRLEWPCWGKPVLFKADNAREFRGKVMEEGLRIHGIDREFRPVARPHYGGHIERLLGTFAREIHTLPGTTFSSVHEKGDYDAEGRAVMTLDAFDTWLTTYILGVYHRRVHENLDMTPLEAWQRGLLEGTDDHPATGLPERVMGDAARRLRLDLLPFFEATVQAGGMVHLCVRYRGEALVTRIGERNPEHRARARLFRCRYDPRDISRVYFLDPELDQYFELHATESTFPAMSIWELKKTRRFARANRLRVDDELAIIHAYGVMVALLDAEKQTTREVRTEAEKRRWREKLDAGAPKIAPEKPSPGRPTLSIFEDWGDLEPFEDVQD